jgi:RecJ-like exonuclease
VKKINALLIVFLLFASACNRENPASRVATPKSEKPAVTDQIKAIAQGKVVETMNTGGYTYVQVDTGSDKIWAAAPECLVKVGDRIAVPVGTPMRNFHSKSLDRDFELIYFVNTFQNSDGDPLTKGDSQLTGSSPMAHNSIPVDIDVSGVAKAEGGKDIGEIYTNKADLSGKKITVRGKVVKFNQQIMGKNWLHIRDGSGDAAAHTNDLTVTTNAEAKVGNTVLVTGEVHLDKDFGYGYKYDVILEDAQVVVE